MTSGTLLLAFALAQTPAPAANATIGSIRAQYDTAKGYLLKAVEQVPEEHFAFKPTPEVRSLGQLFGHIANANFMICGMASGEKGGMGDIEKTKSTKKDLQEALAASFKFCDAAFDSMTDARAAETVPKFFFPGTHTRLSVLAFNTAHDFEHYGNIVTYMRLKGMVPPSSQRGGM
jgi:uncharacterized damage-inducible protein DinB